VSGAEVVRVETTGLPEPPAPGPVAPDPTGGRLLAWARALGAAHQLGSALCQTPFVPAPFRGEPEKTAAAIMFGDELGMTPLQALQAVYVDDRGRVGLYARSMVALAQAAGHEVWTEVKTDSRVVVSGRRRGSVRVETEEWTTARAQRAGYTRNRLYGTDPQAMLLARACADVCRRIAPDALIGIPSAEEVQLGAPAPGTAVTRVEVVGGRTPVRRAAVAGPVVPADPDPAVDEPAPAPAPAVEPAPERGTVTQAQLRRIGLLMREAGLTARADALAFVAQTLGREISSRAELSRDEAHRVISALEPPPPAPADDVPGPAGDADLDQGDGPEPEVDPETGEVVPADLWDGPR